MWRVSVAQAPQTLMLGDSSGEECGPQKNSTFTPRIIKSRLLLFYPIRTPPPPCGREHIITLASWQHWGMYIHAINALRYTHSKRFSAVVVILPLVTCTSGLSVRKLGKPVEAANGSDGAVNRGRLCLIVQVFVKQRGTNQPQTNKQTKNTHTQVFPLERTNNNGHYK